MIDTRFTTPKAAEYLKLSRRRIRILIDNGRIPAEKIGRDYLIKQSDLDAFAAQPRRAGRPGKGTE